VKQRENSVAFQTRDSACAMPSPMRAEQEHEAHEATRMNWLNGNARTTPGWWRWGATSSTRVWEVWVRCATATVENP